MSLLVHMFKETCRVIVKLREGVTRKMTELNSFQCKDALKWTMRLAIWRRMKAWQSVGRACAKVLGQKGICGTLEDMKKARGSWQSEQEWEDYKIRLEWGQGLPCTGPCRTQYVILGALKEMEERDRDEEEKANYKWLNRLVYYNVEVLIRSWNKDSVGAKRRGLWSDCKYNGGRMRRKTERGWHLSS